MKQKILIFGTLLIVLIIVGYYLTPKNIKSCGSTLPIQCFKYRCDRGFPYRDMPIGGSSAKCFLGGEPILEGSQ